mgnify:FL=1
MIGRRNLIAVAVALTGSAIVGGLSGCGKEEAAQQGGKTLIPIGIVQLVEHEALDAANRGIVDALAERGYKEGVNVTIDRQNAQADQSNLQNIAARFVSNDSKILFAIATPAAQTLAAATKTIPIVATAVTNFEVAKLVASNEKPGGNVTGVSDINPVAEQFALLMKFAPDAKAIGTIYNSSEINSTYQIELLKKAASAAGVEVVEASVSSVNDIQQAVASLKGKVGGLYLPTDNIIASAVPVLMKSVFEAGIPTVAGEGGMVRAGILASIAVDYYTLGKMTGAMGADILDGKKKPADMPIQSQKAEKVLINLKTAETMGIQIPEDILKTAETVK